LPVVGLALYRPRLQYDRRVATKGLAKDKPQLLHSEKLARLPWLVHAFSTRSGGVPRLHGENALNLGFTKHDSPKSVEQNRELLQLALGLGDGTKPWPLITLRQIHSDLIHRVERGPEPRLVGDGLITDVPELLLAVQTADCLPVIVVDRKRRAAGVFHAGWRGTVKRIVEKGVGEMRRHFNSHPRNLIAAIGPGIHGCCYEIGEEVRTQFEMQFAYAAELFRQGKDSDPVRAKYPLLFLTARPPGHDESRAKLFLDLVEANRRQLMDSGITPARIEASSHCTACRRDLFFSYRADKGMTGRMMGVVGIKA
jgi:polyphenol oxidase